MNDIQAKILIVDDEEKMRKLLEYTFTSQGHKVFEAVNGREGATFASTKRPDLIILDLGLPDIGGLEVLKQIRQWSQVPLIVLTVQSDPETIIEALNSGADDYMTKPFAPGELVARAHVCLRRTFKKDHEQEIFEAKGIEVNLVSRVVSKGGKEIKLTSTEYDLLKLFIKNADKILTTRQILKEVWGPGAVEHTHYPRVYVRHLRLKLEDNPEDPRLIQTEIGIGYRLKTKD